MDVRIVPMTLKAAKQFAAEHHRHHKKRPGDLWAIGLEISGGGLVAVAVVGRPSAPALAGAFEVTRLTSIAPIGVNACSRLYGACARAAAAMGFRRGVTYTRLDEPGTSLRAANWWPATTTEPEDWTRRAAQAKRPWLPGLYQPTTEVAVRVRWETGPDAAPEAEQLRQLGRRAA